ncbi:MAG: YdbL family protein [Gammaproteobacteria bacterium]|nr:YdbL family protein [Gammaproteobacteria bacterium]NNJ83912.1 YdbL family protein [Gammaproteobacteria bacterium]
MKNKIQMLFLVGMLLISAPLFALSLADAKSQGLVGETSSGYIDARGSKGAVQSLVTSVNAKRRARYKEISARNGTSLDAVEKLAAKKLIERVRKGEYYKKGGTWKQR